MSNELKLRLSNVVAIKNPAEFELTNNYYQDKFLVAYVSHISLEKGYNDAINYVRSLALSNVDVIFEFHVAGSLGMNIDEFNLINYSIKGIVNLEFVFHGVLELNELRDLYSRLDCLVFLSNYSSECVPLVVMNAVYNGIPVIASDIGYLRDFLPDLCFSRPMCISEIKKITYSGEKVFIRDFHDKLNVLFDEYISHK
jgi:glycosyltransferase involved in cell wall biosynthesis